MAERRRQEPRGISRDEIPAKLTVRCTRAEKNAMIAAAERAGTKLEPWVQRVLAEAVEREADGGEEA